MRITRGTACSLEACVCLMEECLQMSLLQGLQALHAYRELSQSSLLQVSICKDSVSAACSP